MDLFVFLHVAVVIAVGLAAHCFYRIWKDPS